MKYWTARVAAVAALFAPIAARAQDAAADVADSGDTAWILVASAFVLLMAAPGLTLFYGGLVRAKNFLSVLVQCGAIVAACSLLWIMVGYTLAFGPVTNGWIGAGTAFMFNNLGNVREGYAVPESAYALFQMTFAAITPALMVGAWVDRARFSWVVTFCAIWSLVVYAPVAHWIWGGGWLATKLGRAGLCRGHRGPHHRRRLGVGGSSPAWPAQRVSQDPDAAAQPGPDHGRGGPAVDGLVRLQRRLGPGRHRRCGRGDHQHPRRGLHGGTDVDRDRAFPGRQVHVDRLRNRGESPVWRRLPRPPASSRPGPRSSAGSPHRRSAIP